MQIQIDLKAAQKRLLNRPLRLKAFFVSIAAWMLRDDVSASLVVTVGEDSSSRLCQYLDNLQIPYTVDGRLEQ